MHKYSDLAGKVVLVTGAGSGIGKATALAFGEQGAVVAVHYHRNEKGAEDTKREIVAHGGRAMSVRADVTKAEDVRAAVSRVTGELGPVDVLVNNAGSLVERLRLLQLSESRWADVLDLNLKSIFLLAQAVAQSMIERKNGAIVNVTSIAGRNGGGLGAIPYATSKGGATTMTKALAKELAPQGIRVNAVSPGVIETPFHDQFSTPEMMKQYVGNIPLGRLGAPAEVANVIVFLASIASSYIVGETIEINGGLLMD